MGSGDLFETSISCKIGDDTTYCIKDCIGNTSQFSYIIESSGEVMNPLEEGHEAVIPTPRQPYTRI